MKPTSDKFFVDSNVLLYILDKDGDKKTKAKSLLKATPCISPQIIFECLNVAIRKLKLSKADALDFCKMIIKHSEIVTETADIVINALYLFERFQLQIFDSKIIASALLSDCSVLYSEDMQNGLIINDSLTIVNPFL